MTTPPTLRPTIYAVYAKLLDRDKLLGYATGTEEDIFAFFADKRGYGLHTKVVCPQHIPPGYADKRAALLQEKKNLEQAMRRVDKEIKNIGG